MKWLTVVVVVAGLWLIGSVGEDDPTAGGSDASQARGTRPRSAPEDPSGPARSSRHDRPGSKPRDDARPTRSASPRTYVVTRVVDGDTLELGNGETVRLVGIDTPEVGECGFERASAALSQLVLGKAVTLAVSDEDRDRYDRLLRYVDVGRLDAGLELIRDGLAVARYDSRDGYGFHPREPRYVTADHRSPAVQCAASPRPLAAVPPASGGACAPGYDPCVPPYPPDVDCGDLDGPIRVTGDDPHGLDGDGDGSACE